MSSPWHESKTNKMKTKKVFENIDIEQMIRVNKSLTFRARGYAISITCTRLIFFSPRNPAASGSLVVQSIGVRRG
jgi:hypothetical protein